MNINEIYEAARRIADKETRRAFLEETCKHSPEAIQHLEALLARSGDGFPSSPYASPDTATLSELHLEVSETPLPEGVAPPQQADRRGEIIGGVKLLRLISEGGMGCVYEGRQGSPRRSVAVKLVKPSVTSPNLLRRIEFEAQILGRLKHPGIAQIYAAGTHQTSNSTEPYFVMEYIANAKSLTTYANDLQLSTHQRLKLFQVVCEAVAHGHQKGIIHRDLKPSNILVDASGNPKVIDFGVAKTTDSDMALTTVQTDVGRLIGTYQYMSPEQFEADPHGIDVRSDVYALGVVLYELLTGQPPYNLKQRILPEIASIVRQHAPTPIANINRTLRRDVAVISNKCLEKDRNRRYASASELASDVSRYLRGEPITAAAPTLLDGLTRLAKAHKAVAVATATIAISLIAAVIGISVFAVQAEQARRSEMHQRSVSEELRREAEKQRSGAVTARDMAVEARRDAEELVAYMTFDLRDKLEPLGRLDLLGDVLQQLKLYHEARISRELEHDAKVSREDLRRRGVFYNTYARWAFETGRTDDAVAANGKAFSIAEQLVQEDSTNRQWARDLAFSWKERGLLSAGTGDIREAITLFQGSLTLYEALGRTSPADKSLKRELAETQRSLAVTLGMQMLFEDAQLHAEEALSIARGLDGDDATDTADASLLADCLHTIGSLASVQENLKEAAAIFDELLDTAKRLLAHDPTNTQWQSQLAVAHQQVGLLAARRFEWEIAGANLTRSFEILTDLVGQDSTNTVWKATLAAVQSELSNARTHMGMPSDTHASSTPVTSTLLLAVNDPVNAIKRAMHAIQVSASAGKAFASGDLEKAAVQFQECHDLLEALDKENPGHAIWQAVLGESKKSLGDIANASGDSEAAKTHFSAAIAILKPLSLQDSANPAVILELGWLYERMGTLAKDAGELAVANENYARFRDICDQLVSLHPEVDKYQWHSAIANERLGDVALLQEDEELAVARDCYAKCFAVVESLAAKSPGSVELKNDLGWSHERQALVRVREKQYDKAREHYLTFCTIFEELAESHPEIMKFHEGRATAYGRLGDLAQRESHGDAAVGWYRKKNVVADHLLKVSPSTKYTRIKVRTACELLDAMQQAGIAGDATGELRELVAQCSDDVSRLRGIADEVLNAHADSLSISEATWSIATQAAERAAAVEPANAECWHTLAHVLAKQTRYQEAVKAQKTALENASGDEVDNLRNCLAEMEGSASLLDNGR